MAKFDLKFELDAEGLTLSGYEVYSSEVDPIGELVAEANDLGNAIVEMVGAAKRVLGVDREPFFLWQERALDPLRDEEYFYSKSLRMRMYIRKLLKEVSTMQGVVENRFGGYRPVREWAIAWYKWATSSLEDVGLMTDYERALDLFILTGEEPILEVYIKDVAKRLRYCKTWLKDIQDNPIDGGYLEHSVGEDVDMLSDELKFYRELRLIELQGLGRC